MIHVDSVGAKMSIHSYNAGDGMINGNQELRLKDLLYLWSQYNVHVL